MRTSSLNPRALKRLAADARDYAATQTVPAVVEEALCIASAMEELHDRRKLMSTYGEYRVLERSQAYSGACSIIDCCCRKHDDAELFSDSEFEDHTEQECKDAILYLDLRGLIDRDPEMPGWFAIRNESEATV